MNRFRIIITARVILGPYAAIFALKGKFRTARKLANCRRDCLFDADSGGADAKHSDRRGFRRIGQKHPSETHQQEHPHNQQGNHRAEVSLAGACGPISQRNDAAL